MLGDPRFTGLAQSRQNGAASTASRLDAFAGHEFFYAVMALTSVNGGVPSVPTCGSGSYCVHAACSSCPDPAESRVELYVAANEPLRCTLGEACALQLQGTVPPGAPDRTAGDSQKEGASGAEAIH